MLSLVFKIVCNLMILTRARMHCSTFVSIYVYAAVIVHLLRIAINYGRHNMYFLAEGKSVSKVANYYSTYTDDYGSDSEYSIISDLLKSDINERTKTILRVCNPNVVYLAL